MRGDSSDTGAGDRFLADNSADELIEQAFPSNQSASPEVVYRHVFAVIPGEAFSTTPEEFSTFLEGIFDSEEEFEANLERCLSAGGTERAGNLARRVRALVPEKVLSAFDPSGFVDEIFNAFDEIDSVLSSLQAEARASGSMPAPATAVVPEEAIADPQDLIRAIDRVRSESEKFDLLFRQARHSLNKLRGYRLTKRTPGEVLSEMRQANHIPTLQYLIDFLGSILNAAGSFEKLDLPKPHIREYLEYLYRMEDWDEMAELVRRLQEAVQRYWQDRE